MKIRNILIAPDKFKGTLTAREAADAIARGLRRSRPEWRMVLLPIADGGDGTTDAMLASGTSFVAKTVPTVDALGAAVTSKIIFAGHTAFFESAAAVGLARLQPSQRAPWEASSRGVGLLLKSAAARGADRILVGLGGTATNDGGLGLAAELGWRFLDSAGAEIDPIPKNFGGIRRILRPTSRSSCEIIGLCDVTNPLLGTEGASAVYGPQKGLCDPQIMDRALLKIADLVTAETGQDFRGFPGAGAGGGLGYGVLTFCAGRLTSGFRCVSEMLQIEAAVQNADLIITGEGKLDRQSLFGKGPSEIARLGRAHGKKTVAFCGVAEVDPAHREVFDHTISITNDKWPLTKALNEPAAALEAAAYAFGIDAA